MASELRLAASWQRHHGRCCCPQQAPTMRRSSWNGTLLVATAERARGTTGGRSLHSEHCLCPRGRRPGDHHLRLRRRVRHCHLHPRRAPSGAGVSASPSPPPHGALHQLSRSYRFGIRAYYKCEAYASTRCRWPWPVPVARPPRPARPPWAALAGRRAWSSCTPCGTVALD